MIVKAIEDIDCDDIGHGNWQPAIYIALYVYRTSPHNATGVSSAYLLYRENILLLVLYSH